MAIPLLSFHGVSTPGRGPGGTSGVFFWVRGDRQHTSAPPVFTLSGTDIDAWYDQSYYDHHLFAAGAPRPTRLPGASVCAAQTLDTVAFVGGADKAQSLVFEESFLNFSLVQKVAIHLVFRATNNVDATLFSIHYLGINRDGITISITPGGIVGRITLGIDCGGGNFVPTLFTLPGFLNYNDGQVHSVSFMYDQTLPSNNLKLIADGLTLQVSLNTNGMLASSKIVTTGQYDNSPSFSYNGELLEVIAQLTATDAERLIIYDYFQRKWCSN